MPAGPGPAGPAGPAALEPAGPGPAALGPVGLALPQAPAGDGPAGPRVAAAARRAEELGVGAVWALEQVHGRQPTLDPLAVLALAAGVTSRVALGVAVLVLPARAPLTLAASLATIDRLSGGRLHVGVGLGDTRILAAHGLGDQAFPVPGIGDERGLGGLLEAELDVLEALWTGEPLHAGVGPYRLRGEAVPLLPATGPGRARPPLWLGGRSAAALRRAARRADGWVAPGKVDVATFARDVARLRELVAAEGRDAAAFPVAKRLYLHVEVPGDGSSDGVAAWFERFYGEERSAVSAAVVGPPARAREAVAEVLDAGAGHVVVHPVVDEERQVELLAEHVLPGLR